MTNLYDVIIIGGGISGLGAAKVLSKHDLNVKVLEARSRHGGRICTLQLPAHGSLPEVDIDCGANYLIGCSYRSFTSNPLFRMAFRLDIESSSIPHGYWEPVDTAIWRTSDGEVIPWSEIKMSFMQLYKIIFKGLEIHFPKEMTDIDKRLRTVASHIARAKTPNVDLHPSECVVNCRKRKSTEAEFELDSNVKHKRFHKQAQLDEYANGICTVKSSSDTPNGISTATSSSRTSRDGTPVPCEKEKETNDDPVMRIQTNNQINAVISGSTSHSDPGQSPCLPVAEEPSLQSSLHPSESAKSHNDDSDETKSHCSSKSSEFSGVNQEPSFSDVFNTGLAEVLKAEFLLGIRDMPTLSARERDVLNMAVGRLFLYVVSAEKLKARELLESGPIFLNAEIDWQNDGGYPWLWWPYFFWFGGEELVEPPLEHRMPRSVPRKPEFCDFEDRLVVANFGAIVDQLATGVSIDYDAVVRDIVWNQNGGVQVTVSNGRSYYANQCIITVPVGVLNNLDPTSSISFHPPLPAAKRQAIQNLSIESPGDPCHNKVFLRFEKRFWEDKPFILCLKASLNITNLDYFGKPGLLMLHIWASSDFPITGQSDEEVVSRSLNLLKGMYQHDVSDLPEPVQAVVTRWSEDPFTLGSYTPERVTEDPSDRRIFAAPLPSASLPTLLFAGEAAIPVDEARECTHGALFTGIDAAKLVLQQHDLDFRIPGTKLADFLCDLYTLPPQHAMLRRPRRRKPKVRDD